MVQTGNHYPQVKVVLQLDLMENHWREILDQVDHLLDLMENYYPQVKVVLQLDQTESRCLQENLVALVAQHQSKMLLLEKLLRQP